ncbi:MAG: hypothetical protein COA42_15105 [Alteromonadaceae bacterium]|nr:MAG: hypothetical protein COA42_15105 [Alteromonadaceae bacterium]
MKKIIAATSAALLGVSLAVNTLAHDPKEHMKKSEKADCSTMGGMDHSKMDMNDPVMQAIMKKCMPEVNHDEKAAEDSHDTKSHKHSDH